MSDEKTPWGIELAPGISTPAEGLRFAFVRSGGPGGQNVNKLSTKAQLHVRVGALVGLSPAALDRLRALAGHRLTAADEILLVSESERGQEANKAAVLERLREMIVRAKVEPKRRRKTKPSKRAKARRMDQKRHRGEIKSGRRFRME